MNKTFYYNFKAFNLWLLFNIIITVLTGLCFIEGWQIILYPQMWTIIGSVIFSWAMWYYKYVHPQTMAVINDESIKIDHTAPLKWKDISHAKEVDVWCFFRKRHVLSLVPKKNIKYQYNWLQRHNPFPPFSIPLYGLMTPKDEKEIVKSVAKKVKLK